MKSKLEAEMRVTKLHRKEKRGYNANRKMECRMNLNYWALTMVWFGGVAVVG